MGKTNGNGADVTALLAQLQALQAENAALKASAQSGQAIKIGQSGGVSVYGLGRFPTTLHRKQWRKLFARQAEVEAFFAAHKDELDAVEAKHEAEKAAKKAAKAPVQATLKSVG